MSSSPQSPGSAASKPAAPEPAAPEPASRPKWGRALWTAALVCLALLGPASSAWAGPSGDLGGMELTAPVRHQLWRLQQAWQEWSKHFIAGDREKADNEIQQLLSITEHLGMARLPDLSTAAAAFSVKYAREGDFERAYWALTAAEELDFGRPETAFARSTVQRLEGDFFGAVISGMRGYIAVLQMPLERKLWLNNIGLWLLFTLLMSGVVFVCLLMLTQGRKLFYDLSRLYSPPLQPLAANLVTLLLLLWPLFLPSGWVWLVIFWSVLLWAYGTSNQRGTLIALWLLLGLTPVAVSYQQRATQVALVPASRLVDNLAAGRLYGSMFSDLEVLRSVVPDSDVVTEIIADLHRFDGASPRDLAANIGPFASGITPGPFTPSFLRIPSGPPATPHPPTATSGFSITARATTKPRSTISRGQRMPTPRCPKLSSTSARPTHSSTTSTISTRPWPKLRNSAATESINGTTQESPPRKARLRSTAACVGFLSCAIGSMNCGAANLKARIWPACGADSALCWWPLPPSHWLSA